MNQPLVTLRAAACAVALAASASAQITSPMALQPEKVPGAIKHAGIYHVASGTWTRSGATSANFGPDTVYSNTATSGYFSPSGGASGFASGSTNFDEGVLPTTANTGANADRDSYLINCVSIGYCDFGAAGSSGWELDFYSDYTPCTFESSLGNRVAVRFLPAGGCWTVGLDLTGQEFCMAGDGGDGFDDDPELDSFGWSYHYIGWDGSAPAGFLTAGDPQSTDRHWIPGAAPSDGTNTYFGAPSLCGPDQATGFFTSDSWWLEDPVAGNSGCYFFGGYVNGGSCGLMSTPFASWYLELQADTSTCTNLIISSPSGCLSAPSSTGLNTTMVATGSTSVAEDDVTLTAAIPVNSFGFFITARTPGFVGMPGGAQGNVCLGSDIGRFQQLAMNSGATGEVSISTTAGQWSLGVIPAGSGAYAAVPGTSAYFQCWHRDSSGSQGPLVNFTDGCVVHWTL